MPKLDAENQIHDPLIELREYVDQLTQPVTSKVLQDGPPGSGLAGVTVARVTLPALLDQLEEAVRGTIGVGGSHALPSERNMLDADALHRFVMIVATIKDWSRDLHVGHRASAKELLRAWYVRFVEVPRELSVVRFHLRKVGSWVSQIEAKLDPPRVRELPDACPKCGATDWFNPADRLRYLHPLVVLYRPTGPDMIQEAQATCRSCEARWGVRQLAYEIESATRRDSP